MGGVGVGRSGRGEDWAWGGVFLHSQPVGSLLAWSDGRPCPPRTVTGGHPFPVSPFSGVMEDKGRSRTCVPGLTPPPLGRPDAACGCLCQRLHGGSAAACALTPRQVPLRPCHSRPGHRGAGCAGVSVLRAPGGRPQPRHTLAPGRGSARLTSQERGGPHLPEAPPVPRTGPAIRLQDRAGGPGRRPREAALQKRADRSRPPRCPPQCHLPPPGHALPGTCKGHRAGQAGAVRRARPSVRSVHPRPPQPCPAESASSHRHTACLPPAGPSPALYLGWRNLAHCLGSDCLLPGYVCLSA